MSIALQRQDERELYYSRLTSGLSSPNHEWLACMVASWSVGQGVLPDYLGLTPAQFQQLKAAYFQGCDIPELAVSGSQLDFSRMLEKEDLVNLLTQHCRPDMPEMDWMIAIIVAGCLGSDHLWQDLGLWSRSQLTAMLQYNFPTLAAKNDQDMKWKKFLYKQLCEAEGIYLCRAPSCTVCIDYPKCYGPEN
ncbi:MAG: nitrogen fixation protein NifQ [Methylococcales bacterium]|nr:nitrogen fixation protein NifQ [Methylococcales bacterium]